MDDESNKPEGETPAAKRAAIIEGLQKLHKVIVIEDRDLGELGLVVFRAPNMMEYRKFKRENRDEGTTDIANQTFLTTLVVYPSKSEFTTLLDGMPGLVDSLTNAVGAAVGLRKFEAKKL